MSSGTEVFPTASHESQFLIDALGVQDVPRRPDQRTCIGAAFILTNAIGRLTNAEEVTPDTLRQSPSLMELLVENANGMRKTNRKPADITEEHVLRWLAEAESMK